MGNKSRNFQYDPHKMQKFQTGNSMGLPDQKLKHFKIDGHISAGKNGGVLSPLKYQTQDTFHLQTSSTT